MNEKRHYLSEAFEMFSDETALVVTNVIGTQARSLQPVCVNRVKTSVKYVEKLCFFENKSCLTPKIFDNTEQYGVQNLGWSIQVDV